MRSTPLIVLTTETQTSMPVEIRSSKRKASHNRNISTERGAIEQQTPLEVRDVSVSNRSNAEESKSQFSEVNREEYKLQYPK